MPFDTAEYCFLFPNSQLILLLVGEDGVVGE
jgi:hypothetical protein